MKTLYFDCFSGISGDMVIGALIDAGADPTILEEELKKLKIDDEYELKWNKTIKNGITGTKFDVVLTKKTHDHSHEGHHHHDHPHEGHHHHDHSHEGHHHHDHSHEGHHHHDHSHEGHHHHDHPHEGHHHHDHSHEGHSHHHAHEHRSYQDIVKLITSADFSDEVKNMSLNIFKRIGEAEARIHGIPLEKVHFHEVGAVDSIIDVIGTAILIDQLGTQAVKSSAIAVGTGSIHIDHGVYPVPAPATLEILRGVPIQQSTIRAELATPTGAAIVSVLAEEFCTIPSMKIQSIGYGAGTKSFKDHPNVLRVIIGE